jgi:hypothetical protein
MKEGEDKRWPLETRDGLENLAQSSRHLKLSSMYYRSTDHTLLPGKYINKEKMKKIR